MAGPLKTLGATLRGGLAERIALMAPSRRLRLAQADEALSEYAGERAIRVLDAGSGDGLLTLPLARRHPAWSVVGMELSDSLLSAARERAANRELGNVSFEKADLTERLPDWGFDAAIALECLTEIPEDRRALGSVAEALAPGGLLVVQVPEAGWKPVLPGSSPTWRHEVRHGYRAAELIERLAEAGLERIEVTPTYRSTAAAAQEVRDRVKGWPVAIRAAVFPFMVAAVRLERWGLTFGPPNALFAVARRPRGTEGAHGGHFA
jgi:trans-aconitate methyltransferase